MGWRIVSVSSVSKLDYKMDYLVVRNQDGTKRIHLSEISVLILESTAISLTAYLLCELSRNKIDVIFCDEKRCPYGVLAPLYGSYDTSLKYRTQIAWTEESKAFVWAEIVRAKIWGQYSVLPTSCQSERNLLQAYTQQIEPGDTTNREGHAAKVYFNALFGMAFSRSLENNINAALNYGYGILLSVFAREIVSNGYCTQLGIFHDNMFNQFNLASDFMEPFRPFIDRAVHRMKLEAFEHDEKVAIIQVLNEQIIIDGKQQYVINAIRIYCKSLFDALEEKDISKIRFPSYEL
jgi:CRISPR-associated endonuclease Cas1 subtype II